MQRAEVTLDEVMGFREIKAIEQRKMLEYKTDGIVVALGMNIPGPVKSGPSIKEAFQQGKDKLDKIILQQKGTVLQKSEFERKAGYAVIYLVFGIDKWVLKKETVYLEESHPLGRIFDIDVIGEDAVAITREMVYAKRRSCLLCEQDAKVCGRSRNHSVKELQDKVLEIIELWKAGKML
ncbi:MAG: citrate lyase holo-[acyl-carrier protein] synthase [Lachnospiraceae bacterium]|nr:citrate lyase holo-[acyl-carrier protein] synthase [Lachnospiraceae bacterium]